MHGLWGAGLSYWAWGMEEVCSRTRVAVNRWAWGFQETLGRCAAILVLDFKAHGKPRWGVQQGSAKRRHAVSPWPHMGGSDGLEPQGFGASAGEHTLTSATPHGSSTTPLQWALCHPVHSREWPLIQLHNPMETAPLGFLNWKSPPGDSHSLSGCLSQFWAGYPWLCGRIPLFDSLSSPFCNLASLWWTNCCLAFERCTCSQWRLGWNTKV